MSDRLDNRPYIAVTNELFRHPKFIRLTDKAKLHLLELWAYCNEYQTDGLIHKTILEEKGRPTATLLRDVGWVDDTNEKDTFYMHDYLEHQNSRAAIERRREERKAQGAYGGTKGMHVRWHVNKGVYKEDCEHCISEA
jgi:hypothetical protein